MLNSGIDVCEQHERLPSFYWLPKLHKTPYGTRFIAASNRCTTKQLSALLTSWIIDNSKEVLDRLQNINKNSRATSFDSYDFATLYTNIPHDELKNNIRVLVHEAFKVRGAKYLVVNRHGKAHWSLVTSLTAECTSIDESKLLEWMEYLINNVYIKVGNRVYRQTIGIPMGTDCAPQMANLFLFHYEYSYMKRLMRDNLCIAKRFSDTVRYIDDLLTLNNNSFEEEIINIYTPELTLKKTIESNSKIYLDISISICNNKYVTEVYDKRENFNFNIVNYPYMCSNIPAKPTIFLQNLHMECMCHSSSGLVGYVIIM